MEGRRKPPERSTRPKGQSPAERAEAFTAEQRRLKQEASERRAAREAAEKKGRKRS